MKIDFLRLEQRLWDASKTFLIEAQKRLTRPTFDSFKVLEAPKQGESQASVVASTLYCVDTSKLLEKGETKVKRSVASWKNCLKDRDKQMLALGRFTPFATDSTYEHWFMRNTKVDI
jgi:hypothetical protein